MTMSPLPNLNLNNLKTVKVLGTGATGTVFLVHNLITDPSAKTPFALKVVDKTCRYSDKRTHWEINVLNNLNENPHPFLPYLIGSCETNEFISWAIPYCHGRDLNVLRYRQPDNVFSVNIIRFYLAEIVCALEHLHSLGIVYRDLKPENILIQESGHVTLTDFDLSRKLTPCTSLGLSSEKKTKSTRVAPVTCTGAARGERSNSFVGTEEYLSPEMVRGDGHEFGVDWWAVGILAYEMLYGTTPFRGKNRKDTYGRIIAMQPRFNGKSTPLTDFITKLLDKDPTRRLGYRRGAWEIKEHPFFVGLRWDMLTEVVRPPYIPSRDNDELTVKSDGIDIKDYFRNKKITRSSLDSVSCNVSLTEF
ncbi:serine/threonine-protein kinase UCN-like protein [Tanacetum coccineum]